MEHFKNLQLQPIQYTNEQGKVCSEKWMPIPEFENFYYVSDLGRIKSAKKEPHKILKQQNGGSGYLKIELYKDGNYKRCSVHRLVMLAFEGESDLVVDHKNETRNDNRLSNLRYLTNRDNISRGFKNKTSDYTGVYWDKTKGKFRAHLRINTIGYNLGCFTSQEDAKKVYEINLKNWLEFGILPKKVNRRTVQDQQTGEYFNSVKEAAESVGLTMSYLSAMLNGRNTNKTSFIFIE